MFLANLNPTTYTTVLGQLPPRKISPPPPPPPPATTKLALSQTLTVTGPQFSSGTIVWLPLTLKLTLTLTQTPTLTRGKLSFGGDCPDTKDSDPGIKVGLKY